MERIRFIVEQIAQSKEFLLQGDVSHFRMAHVLLDNAAEIMMFRVTDGVLRQDEYYEEATNRMKAKVPLHVWSEIQQKYPITFMGRGRRKVINKYFGEKVKFLSEDKKHLPRAMAVTLASLHGHRNAMYHRDTVRKDLVGACAILLYEIVCDLLVLLPPSGYTSLSTDDRESLRWRLFLEKYKLNESSLFHGGMGPVRQQLRKGISISCRRLRTVLQKHLRSRVADSIRNIDFVRTDGLGLKTRRAEFHGLARGVPQSRERTLRIIQLYESDKENRKGLSPANFDRELRRLKARYSMQDIQLWKKRIRDLNFFNDKYELFNAFTDIESSYQSFEDLLERVAREVDEVIQTQIDIARGK